MSLENIRKLREQSSYGIFCQKINDCFVNRLVITWFFILSSWQFKTFI